MSDENTTDEEHTPSEILEQIESEVEAAHITIARAARHMRRIHNALEDWEGLWAAIQKIKDLLPVLEQNLEAAREAADLLEEVEYEVEEDVDEEDDAPDPKDEGEETVDEEARMEELAKEVKDVFQKGADLSIDRLFARTGGRSRERR